MELKRDKYPLPAPMLLPVVFWTAGIILAGWLDLSWKLPGIVTLVVLLAAILSRTLRPCLVLLLFLLLGFLRLNTSFQPAGIVESAIAERGNIRQEISFRIIRRISERAYAVRLIEIAGYKANDQLLLFDTGEYAPGISYSGLADMQKLSNDPILDIYPNRYTGSIKLVLPPVRNPDEPHLSLSASAAQFVMQRLIRLPEKHAGLAKALLLSDSSFKNAQQGLLSKAGISHLVVVSGLHVLLLYFIIITLLRFFLPFRVADAVFLILICGFAALNHWAAPITRAILMIALAILAKWLSRPLSAAQNLSLSLFIITLFRPSELFSIGLILSFSSVALIVFALPKFSLNIKRSGLLRYLILVANYMLLSLIVGIGLLPFSLHYFGTASLNSVIANLLGLPLMAVLLGLSLTLLVFPITPFYAAYSFTAELWESWLKLSAALPFQLQDYWLSAAQSIALAMVLVALALAIKSKWRTLKYAGLPLLICAGLLFLWPQTSSNKVIIFNAGTADCSLILTKNGQRILIDTGGLSSQRAETSLSETAAIYEDSWALRKLIRWLHRARIRDLDYLIVTHLHSDHAGGLPALTKHCKVKNLLLTQSALQSDDWVILKPQLDLANTRIFAIRDTMSLFFGQQRLKIVHPDRDFRGSDENNFSIVCRFDDGLHRYLFTGDIEAEAEVYLVANYADELAADYLKVPHHGSRGSSNSAFLESVGAGEAWITCASRNIHGFPHPEALARMQAAQMQIYYSHEGSIIRHLAQID